ncbi:MAG: hypothetical protein ABEI86_09045 [Halobacteriaceae archaeon]
MHIEFESLDGGSGRISVQPYSFEYEGPNRELEEWLEDGPKKYAKMVSAPATMGDAEMVEVTDEHSILHRITNDLYSLFDIHIYEIK